MKEILSQYINSLCEVRDMENEFLITGKIRKVLEIESKNEENTLAVEITSSDFEPLPAASYDLPVKIILFGSPGGPRTIGGHVYIANPVFWRVNKIININDLERRDYFRVRVCASGKAYRPGDLSPEEEPEPVPISIVDISLSGILFRTQASFEVNDLIHIFDIQLCDDSPTFSMDCIVRRIEQIPRGGGSLYGCSFVGLSEKEEDALYTTIFKLHRLELQKKRKRL